MHRDFLLGIGLLAAVAAGGGSAVAADMPVRPPPPLAASPVYVPDWVGFYVGFHAGGGWGHSSFEPQFSATGITGMLTSIPELSPNSSGGVFGGQAGYNWQWGPVVGGLEIDFSGADIKGTSSVVVSPTIVALEALAV